MTGALRFPIQQFSFSAINIFASSSRLVPLFLWNCQQIVPERYYRCVHVYGLWAFLLYHKSENNRSARTILCVCVMNIYRRCKIFVAGTGGSICVMVEKSLFSAQLKTKVAQICIPLVSRINYIILYILTISLFLKKTAALESVWWFLSSSHTWWLSLVFFVHLEVILNYLLACYWLWIFYMHMVIMQRNCVLLLLQIFKLQQRIQSLQAGKAKA